MNSAVRVLLLNPLFTGRVRWNVSQFGIRVRRDALEAAILDPVRRDLLSPERVDAMAREMQRYYAERVKTQESRSAQIPHELQQPDARLVRLRECM
jgi:hypothetical protein